MKNLKMMIVEDEKFEKMALHQIISKNFPYIEIVAEPSSGIEAIRLGKQLKPHILFLDIGIPEIDGLSVQKKLKGVFPDLQTIVLTAYSDFDHAHKALTYQVADYLVKPARKEVIIEAVNKVVDYFSKTTEETVHNVNYHEAVVTAINYIEAHYAETLQLKQIAERLFLNPQYFSKLFKKEVGISLGDYLLNFRIEKAKELLETTSLPISIVSEKCGFTETAYFCKKFNSLVNTTPLKYRKAHQVSS